jgi:hypothetical protein
VPDAAAVVAALGSAVEALSALPAGGAPYGALSEELLLEAGRLAARCRDLARTHGALVAGEVARRSAPELGSAGLAQRSGFRTAEEFVKITAGSTHREAVTAVRMGRLMVETSTSGDVDGLTGDVVVPSQPWLEPVAAALRSAAISVDAADAIGSGLGSPNSAVSATELAGAASQLCDEARSLDPDRLFRRARQLRDELDVEGIALREEERRQQRSLKLMTLPSGMGRLVWIMDPETFAVVRETYDRVTSPKRGGVRFVEGPARETAERILADERLPEQLASDGFAELLQLGATTDPDFLLGKGASQIRVAVMRSHREQRPGFGRIEGQADAVSINTVERLGCGGATVDVAFDEKLRPLDVGREQRHFTSRQRIALAIRDGGCRWPGCDRPPSWTEAHHTRFWVRDHGPTDIGLGILLCKHHHLLAHNNGWEIRADEGQFLLVPPRGVDPVQRPVPMPSKSATMRDLQRVADMGGGS